MVIDNDDIDYDLIMIIKKKILWILIKKIIIIRQIYNCEEK